MSKYRPYDSVIGLYRLPIPIGTLHTDKIPEAIWLHVLRIAFPASLFKADLSSSLPPRVRGHRDRLSYSLRRIRGRRQQQEINQVKLGLLYHFILHVLSTPRCPPACQRSCSAWLRTRLSLRSSPLQCWRTSVTR